MATLSEIRVPDLGGFSDVSVIDVLVKEGEQVEVDTPLITLETEKATMDVPSPQAGRIAVAQDSEGRPGFAGQRDRAARACGAPRRKPAADCAEPKARVQHRPVTWKKPSDSRRSARRAQSRQAAPAAAPSLAAAPRPRAASVVLADFSTAYAGPSVRKFARELGVDLARVKGGGPKGRITHEDVKAFVKQVLTGGVGVAPGAAALPKVPEVDFAKFGPVEIRPLNRIQRISGPRLHASWVNIPHVTQFDVADITELEAVRAQLKGKAVKEGIKLTPLAFVVKGLCQGAAGVPAGQLLARCARREPDPEEVPAHRLCGRHSQRTGRAGDPRRRPQGHLRARA